jgi:hypothetical protein
VLKAGKEYKGTFFIDNNEFRNTPFDGTLVISNDNFCNCYIQESISVAIYNSFCNEIKQFKLKGEIIINGKTIHFLSPNAWNSHISTNGIILKSNSFVTGDSYNFSEKKIAKTRFLISGFLHDEDGRQSYQSVNNNYSISYKSRNSIEIEFRKQVTLEKCLDYISSFNDLFTLLRFSPSVIKSVSVNSNGEEFQLYERWLPFDSRNRNLPIDNIKYTPENIVKWFDKFFSFCNETRVASQQFFSTETLNNRYFEQQILYSHIFSFEGFYKKYIKLNHIAVPKRSKTKEPTFNDYIYHFLRKHCEIKNDIRKMHRYKFIDKAVKFRNTFAHDFDDYLDKISNIDCYAYTAIFNKMIRTLLIKDVLGLKDADIPMEEI